MIVDFLGVPGVGKSTFSRALANRLHEYGCPWHLVSSYRPAEADRPNGSMRGNHAPNQIAAALRRIGRPAKELMSLPTRLFGGSREPGTTEKLLRLLPQTTLASSIRMHQYILRLDRSWRLAIRSNRIVLFDQGFLQALCSLMILGPGCNATLANKALELIPMPDTLIRLNAPHEVLAARLVERQRRQGKLERLFELDVNSCLKFELAVEVLDELLWQSSVQVLHADCSSEDLLRMEVERIAASIVPSFQQKWPTAHAAAAAALGPGE